MASRRAFLQAGSSVTVLGLAVAAGLIPVSALAEWNKAAFDGRSMVDIAQALGGAAPVESKGVQLVAPEIVENGSVVRVGAVSNIPGTTQIAILVEKNPNLLAAVFTFAEGTMAEVATNIKMGESSNVVALVKAGDKFYYAAKEVKVTLGGCG